MPMLTAVDMCSIALLRIGANSISSFSEGSREAEVAANIYPLIRDTCLVSHPWNFALTRVNLYPSYTKDQSGMLLSYPIPGDCLRVLSATYAESDIPIDYHVVDRNIETTSADIELRYIKKANEEIFPVFFQRALVCQLSADFCIPLTDSTSRWQALQKAADIELKKAKLIDAQEDTSPSIIDFPLVSERY